jgi:hypothetical protein
MNLCYEQLSLYPQALAANFAIVTPRIETAADVKNPGF